MIRYLTDAANAITSTGLLLSAGSLYFALSGRYEFSIAIALWAMVADQLDGIVAKRTVGRAPATAAIGKSLDGFADLVYGTLVPSVLILALGDGSLFSLITAAALLLAGSLRLSYFNSFGLSSDGRFTGVPLSYDIPLFSFLFVSRPYIPWVDFTSLVTTVFLIMAALHVAPLRIPSPSGAAYALIISYAVCISIALLFIGAT